MELYQLYYFRAIANWGSMSAAAEALNVTQPTLSYALSQLEKELGVALFTRANGKLQLNPMGEVLLNDAEQALILLESSVDRVKAQGQIDAGRVFVGISYNGIVSDALVSFISRFPSIHFFETLPYFDTAIKSLENNAIDILVTHIQYETSKVIQVPLFEDYLVALMQPENSLSALPALDIGDLQSCRIIFKGQPWTMMELLSYQSKKIPLPTDEFDILYEGTDENISLYLAEHGLGVLLLPHSELQWRRMNKNGDSRYISLCAVPLNPELFSHTIYLTKLKKTSLRPYAQKAFSFIQEYYTNNNKSEL